MNWVKTLFSEDSGAEIGYFVPTVVALFACGWVTFIVAHKVAIPDNLGSLTVFVTGITASLYGVNKAARAWTQKNGNGGGK